MAERIDIYHEQKVVHGSRRAACRSSSGMVVSNKLGIEGPCHRTGLGKAYLSPNPSSIYVPRNMALLYVYI